MKFTLIIIAGTAYGEKIFPALKIHFLGKGAYIDITF